MSNTRGISLLRSICVTELISAFHAYLPADFNFSGEAHPGWEFVYVESGSIKAGADGKSYILKKGELVCHKPGEFHSIQPYHGEANAIIFCFHCSSDKMKFFNNKILMINHRQKQYINDIATFASMLFYDKNPLDIARDGGMDRSLSASVETEQLMKNTLELLILSLMTATSTERQKRMESYALHLQRKTLTSDIHRFLEEHLSEKILLTDISKYVSYSPSSIKRIFKEEMGLSIQAYLTALRIVRAKELLLRSFSVTEIAEMVGFETINYFSTVFKKQTGMTPSAFREKYE